MFIRNVYSEAEEKMISQWKKNAEESVGWLDETPSESVQYPVNFRKATREIIRHMALSHDYKNPLYRDPEYAKHTRWGGIIAPPFFMLSVGNGGAHWLHVPPEVGRYVGCHLGEDFKLFGPVREGDTFKVFQGLPILKDLTPDGEQEERILSTFDPIYYYNQDDELVGIFYHILHNVYAAPDAEFDGVMRIGYEMDPSIANQIENVRMTEEYKYTGEQIEAIDKFYINEPRRGKKIRFWEDVTVGDDLPPVIMGPITVWDCAAAMATHASPPIPMMEVRRFTPHECFVDPSTNIPHKGFEIHLSKDVPRLIGWYSHTIVENIIIPFLGRLVSNWMGDDGDFRFFRWRKFANTTIGDTIIGRGRVVRKYVSEEGECLVDIDTCMENVRGFLTNMGPTTIALPSRAKMLYEEDPKTDPDEIDLNLNPENIKKGDKIRIKPRPDWEIPGEYPLTGETAYVYELPVDVPGYVYAVMDNDCTSIDPRAVVGFRMDMIEKI